MRRRGLFGSDEIRVVNEGKIRVRWKFGKLLAKVSGRRERGSSRVNCPVYPRLEHTTQG
jgi:hypothetical protein